MSVNLYGNRPVLDGPVVNAPPGKSLVVTLSRLQHNIVFLRASLILS